MANIIFEKIKIHNFLSFGDAELTLRDRGYVLVSGVNKNPRDGAISNGSGKSSIWSAICWALTGETIQGLSSNLCNLNFIDEGCWVELTFKLDDNEYKITRYKNFGRMGTDLKIFINGEDKSGDGIRKSEALLAQYIPDLTSELIGSVIILGQGLPHRFTNNTPSGRKEVLEKLSKSDFMIEDIKARISKRSTELALKRRTFEDDSLQTKAQVTLYTKELEKEQVMLSTYAVMPDFDGEIMSRQLKINEIMILLETTKKVSEDTYKEYTAEQSHSVELVTEKSKEVSSTKDSFNALISSLNIEISKLESSKTFLESEIRKLESIKDVCPTCNQKLPHVHVQDTTEQKNELEQIKLQLQDKRTVLATKTQEMRSQIATIESKYAEKETTLGNRLRELKTSLDTTTRTISVQEQQKKQLEIEIFQFQTNKSTFEINKQKVLDKIIDINKNIDTLNNNLLYIIRESSILDSHILAIDKMSTLVKRDFRGFLLTNVIEFINAKAKEYCSYVFETNEIEFKLDGNSIDISYCGKEYENLSGGEKQKVDLIIQFSIRDMLCQYLNFSSNILVLDEITDNLDSKGCDKVIDLISNKLVDIESVFIISHHTELLKGIFESEICVEKDMNGVSKIK